MTGEMSHDLLGDQTDDAVVELARNEEGGLCVLVMYQGLRAYAPLAGYTAFEVKRLLKDQWGIPYVAEVCLNGRPADARVRIHNGDRLRFVRLGSKAARDGVTPAKELLDRLIALRTDLIATLTAKMPSEQQAESVIIEVLQFCITLFGPPTSEADRVLLAEVIQLARQQGTDGLAGSLSDILARIAKPSAGLLGPRRSEVTATGGSPYLNAKKAAAYCQVAKQTIYNHSGEIRAQRRGRRGLLFTREALDEWIAGRIAGKGQSKAAKRPKPPQ